MKQLELQLTGGNNKGDREGTDFYPTPPDVTATLLAFLLEKEIIYKGDWVWEPAAGDGRLSNVLCNYGFRVQASDKYPRIYGIHEYDFLTDNPYQDIKFDAIITNPPFSLASEFIVRAIDVAPVVCMLFKGQCWHGAERRNLFMKHRPAYVLPLTWRPDFLFGKNRDPLKTGKNSPTMEVAWTVWIKGETDTRYFPLKREQYK